MLGIMLREASPMGAGERYDQHQDANTAPIRKFRMRASASVGLPGGMNGRALADAARKIRPGLKVMLTTV